MNYISFIFKYLQIDVNQESVQVKLPGSYYLTLQISTSVRSCFSTFTSLNHKVNRKKFVASFNRIIEDFETSINQLRKFYKYYIRLRLLSGLFTSFCTGYLCIRILHQLMAPASSTVKPHRWISKQNTMPFFWLMTWLMICYGVHIFCEFYKQGRFWNLKKVVVNLWMV